MFCLCLTLVVVGAVQKRVQYSKDVINILGRDVPIQFTVPLT